MKKTFLVICLMVILVAPALALAEYNQPIGPNNIGAPQGDIPTASGKITDVNSLASKLTNLGNLFIYLLITIAVIFIIWHVVIYLIKPSEGDRKEAGKSIFYGILGLFIILSIWGLVNILINTFNTNNNVPRDRFPNANFLSR